MREIARRLEDVSTRVKAMSLHSSYSIQPDLPDCLGRYSTGSGAISDSGCLKMRRGGKCPEAGYFSAHGLSAIKRSAILRIYLLTLIRCKAHADYSHLDGQSRGSKLSNWAWCISPRSCRSRPSVRLHRAYLLCRTLAANGSRGAINLGSMASQSLS